MESISSQALWISQPTNVYATDADGNRIVPAPSARLRPRENVIMNVVSPDRFVYHYTSLETAKIIAGNLTLRMGDFQGTNDPKESKDWHFDLFARGDSALEKIDAGKLSSDLSGAIKRHARVLCFCRDAAGLTGDFVEDISLRGHFKARMWAQYGSSHKDACDSNKRGLHSGVCFVLDRNKLIEAARESCGEVMLLCNGNVTYRNRPVIPKVEERTYFADVDVLRRVGFERYWRLHACRHASRLFFEKSLDWRDECEFRILALLDAPREVFIDIRDCLSGLFLGEKCDKITAESLINGMMDRGVHVMGVSWKNCTPWYDIANPIYNFEMRALNEAIRQHDAERASGSV